MDVLRVRIAPKAESASTLAETLKDVIKNTTGVRPEIDTVGATDIYDPNASLKARRFLDKRKDPRS